MVGTFRSTSRLPAQTKRACEWARSRWWPKSIAVWFSIYWLGWSLHFRATGKYTEESKFFCVCAHRSCYFLPRLKNQYMAIGAEGWVYVSTGSLRALPGPAMSVLFWAQSLDIWRVTILRLKKPCISSSSKDAEHTTFPPKCRARVPLLWGLDCLVDRTSLLKFSEAGNKRPKKT